MNKWKPIIGILAFSMVLLCVLYALHQYEKTVYYLEDIETDKQELQVVIDAIHSFQDKQQRLPTSLQELVPNHLEAIPIPKYGEKNVYYHYSPSDSSFELTIRNKFGAFNYLNITNQWSRYAASD